jgi:hypothetical protein
MLTVLSTLGLHRLGFRNRDLRAIFFPQTADDKQQRRAATLPGLAANFLCCGLTL